MQHMWKTSWLPQRFRSLQNLFKKNGSSGSFARRNQSKLVVNVYEFVRVTLLRLVSHYLFAVQRYIGRQMFGQIKIKRNLLCKKQISFCLLLFVYSRVNSIFIIQFMINIGHTCISYAWWYTKLFWYLLIVKTGCN